MSEASNTSHKENNDPPRTGRGFSRSTVSNITLASEKTTPLEYLRYAAVAVAVVALLPVVLCIFVFWSLLGLFFRMPLKVIVVCGWSSVLVLFALSMADSFTGVLAGSMLAQMIVLAAWTATAYQIRRSYRIWQFLYTLASDVAILILSVGYIYGVSESVFSAGFLIACLGTSTYIGINLLKLWTLTSYHQLEAAELALLKDHCSRTVIQAVVAGLGTLIVLESEDKIDDEEEDVKSTLSQRLLPSLPIPKPFNPHRLHRNRHKPAMVLVHGYAAANAYWMLILDGLAEHFEVYAVELYGCGRSDRVPWTAHTTEEAIEVLCSSLERWRHAMGIESMLLLGHSMGCIAVSAYAMAYPSHVKHLLLTSPAGVGEVQRSPPTHPIFRLIAFCWDSGLTPMDAFRWGGPYFGNALCSFVVTRRVSRSPPSSKFHGQINMKHFLEFAYQNYCATASGERALAPLLGPGAWGRKPIVQWLRGSEDGLKCPVSLIYGDQQYDWMSKKDGLELQRKLLDEGLYCDCCEVPGTGHILFIDDPDGFNDAIIRAYNAAQESRRT